MTWTDRADGTSSLDLPGDEWATIQNMRKAGGWWAFRIRRPDVCECTDSMGPFDTAKRAKQAVERLWAGAPWPSEVST